MKYYKPLAWMMAIAIASTTMTACSVKANREKNAAQWETFTKYLESKGKLKK